MSDQHSGSACVERLQHFMNLQTGIRQAILFGSLAGNRSRAGSDVDIAIQLDHVMNVQEKERLIEEIAAITGRSVDLVDLMTAGEPLLGQILQYGKRLAGDNSAYASLLSRHLLDQADFYPYRQRLLEQRRQAWIGL
ncbi:MAG: nucleotidyltransferase domain-containing protein [Mariprofundaceae bacterium]|nr:nucleotidyltransferase domain-containing protein [Mariprofundaceae bacterium]